MCNISLYWWDWGFGNWYVLFCLWLVGDKTISDSTEPRLELFYSPFLVSIYQGQCVVDSFHDDVIKLKHFPRHWTLCGELTGPGEFPSQRPVRRSFDVFFDLCLNKQLSKLNREVGDLRGHRDHYDVMVKWTVPNQCWKMIETTEACLYFFWWNRHGIGYSSCQNSRILFQQLREHAVHMIIFNKYQHPKLCFTLIIKKVMNPFLFLILIFYIWDIIWFLDGVELMLVWPWFPVFVGFDLEKGSDQSSWPLWMITWVHEVLFVSAFVNWSVLCFL